MESRVGFGSEPIHGRGSGRLLSGIPPVVAGTSLLAVACFLVFLAAAPTFTDDFWFHLAMGEVYWNEGLWPASDPMLHTAHQDAPVQHEWLFGVAVFFTKQLTGFHGVRVLHLIAVAVSLWLAFSIARRQTGDFTAACLVAVAFAVLGWTRFYQVRPDLFSIPATLLTYRLLLESGDAPGKKQIVLFGLLALVWVNVHSLFGLGPILLFAGLLSLALRGVVEAWLAPPGERLASISHTRAVAMGVGAALGFGLLVSLLNPRGIEQLLTFFSSSREAAIWSIQDEWSHFDPLHAQNHPWTVSPVVWWLADLTIAGFFVAGLAAALGCLRRSPSVLRVFDPILFGLGAASIVAFLVSVRFLWMAFFPLLFVIRALGVAFSQWKPRWPLGLSWALALLTLLLSVQFYRVGGTQRITRAIPSTASRYLSTPYLSIKYHVEGVRFLRDTGVRGRMFNSYWMGGFLGYWLSPDLRTFIDGRTEHYLPEVLEDYLSVNAMQGADGKGTFLDILERAGVDFFFGIGVPAELSARPQGVYTTAHLEGIPGWIPVSRSLRHAIYLRDLPRNRENLERIAAWYAAEGVPFDPERGIHLPEVIEASPAWAVKQGMLTPALVRQIARRESSDPGLRAEALDALGLVYVLGGAYREAVAVERELLELDAESKASRRRLTYALLRLDRPLEAIEEAWKLRRLDREDPRSSAFVEVAKMFRKLTLGSVASRDPIQRRIASNRLLRPLPLLSRSEAALLWRDLPGHSRVE